MTRTYPNVFARIGVSDEEARARVEAAFETLFFDPVEGVYREVDAAAPGFPASACMEDTGNHDARTEGMSYGMMMAVQMDRKDVFDKLWVFSHRYMLLTEGRHQGYFAWSCQLNGVHNAEGPAPDGEEYYAMALFMAAARWGDGEGVFDYTAQARTILRHCVHQHEMVPGGQPMWEPRNHYIRFVPDTPYTDPSYHLPHFYELFAERADPCDREFWLTAARESRKFIALSAHPETGMSAEYTEYDGTPRLLFGKYYAYYSDAYRVVLNIALDTLWNGRTEELSAVATRLQDFFAPIAQQDFMAYDLDGTPTDEPAMHPLAITAVLGAASIASDSPHADEWLRRLWQEPLRKGDRRYYDNCLYLFALMMLSGMYRVY